MSVWSGLPRKLPPKKTPQPAPRISPRIPCLHGAPGLGVPLTRLLSCERPVLGSRDSGLGTDPPNWGLRVQGRITQVLAENRHPGGPWPALKQPRSSVGPFFVRASSVLEFPVEEPLARRLAQSVRPHTPLCLTRTTTIPSRDASRLALSPFSGRRQPLLSGYTRVTDLRCGTDASSPNAPRTVALGCWPPHIHRVPNQTFASPSWQAANRPPGQRARRPE